MKTKPVSRSIFFGGVLALVLLFLNTNTAQADEYVCNGSVGAITVDNLRVPKNATCTLNGTKVEDNITVENNARLQATNVRVDGNIQAENAARVDVFSGSFVGGIICIHHYSQDPTTFSARPKVTFHCSGAGQ